jgi:hypothetical protein
MYIQLHTCSMHRYGEADMHKQLQGKLIYRYVITLFLYSHPELDVWCDHPTRSWVFRPKSCRKLTDDLQLPFTFNLQGLCNNIVQWYTCMRVWYDVYDHAWSLPNEFLTCTRSVHIPSNSMHFVSSHMGIDHAYTHTYTCHACRK